MRALLCSSSPCTFPADGISISPSLSVTRTSIKRIAPTAKNSSRQSETLGQITELLPEIQDHTRFHLFIPRILVHLFTCQYLVNSCIVITQWSDGLRSGQGADIHIRRCFLPIHLDSRLDKSLLVSHKAPPLISDQLMQKRDCDILCTCYLHFIWS